MTYEIIATGSEGNAVALDRTVLLDCGVPYKKIREIVPTLSLVLLTHRHRDHINKTTIKRLAKERPSLRFGCCEWLRDELLELISIYQLDVYEIGKKYNYGSWAVSPVQLYHDVPQCGYRVYRDEEKVFFATDTGHLDGITAKNYDLYLIEANYGEEEIKIREAAKREKGLFAYEARVPGRHLSREQASAFVLANAGELSKVVFLHQHTDKEGTDEANG